MPKGKSIIFNQRDTRSYVLEY